MRKALIASVAALGVLGLIGGCLVLAGCGFTTSNKRAHWQVFVPEPQAYIMAAILFSLSGIAMLWLLQQSRMRARGYIGCTAAYLSVAFVVTRGLTQWLQ